MCFNFLYHRRYGITKPNNTIKADYIQLYSKLQSEFPEANLNLWDYKYKLAPFSEYVRFIEWDLTDLVEYIKDYHDCDDFALALAGALNSVPKWSSLTFGLLILNEPPHLMCIFVDDEYKVWIVEPQSDKYYKVSELRDKIGMIAEAIIIG